ncbi:DUF6783 domain-containing protein [Lacrimispora sp.]|uniref:DUF6783 domain-containing protein n=1 Tax=Lacrimispora sp. TaxID=2719234 RepID=UPI0028B10331|nr:DUF6783 domain-containing protein [Lacrimispora sp.]
MNTSKTPAVNTPLKEPPSKTNAPSVILSHLAFYSIAFLRSGQSFFQTMEYLKAHFLDLCALLCSIFGPNSVGTVHCTPFIWNKSPTKHAHILE